MADGHEQIAHRAVDACFRQNTGVQRSLATLAFGQSDAQNSFDKLKPWLAPGTASKASARGRAARDFLGNAFMVR
jgi:hypothetical protein